MTLHRTFCRLCTASCGIVVEVDGDEVVGVRGDPDDPVSAGYTCVKGRMIDRHHHSPVRLTTASIGVGPARRTASTAAVVDDLARRLRAIVDEFGPAAIAVYRGNSTAADSGGRRAMAALVAKIGTPNLYSALSIDAVSKSAVQGLVSGTGFTTMWPSVVDDECKLVLLFGSNPVVSHGSSWSNPVVRMRELTRRGEVWVIDPRLTESGRLATHHLAPRPGSDHAILAFLVRELLRQGADERYLAQFATDVDQLRDAVEPFTLAVTADRSGLEEAELLALLASIRRAGRLAGNTGVGLTMSKAPCLAEWLLWCLMIVTGSIDAPGGAWILPDFFGRYDSRPFEPRADDPAARPPARPELPNWGGERPCAALADEILAENVKALLVVGGNPAIGFPDSERTAAALRSLDVLAVTEIGRTATTELATHTIPVTGQLERADLSSTTYRFTPAVIGPVGDRWPTWRVMAHLGRALGVEVLPPGLDPDRCTDEEVVRVIAQASRVNLAERIVPGTTVLADDETVLGWAKENGQWTNRFVLRDHRWQLAPPQLVAQLRAVADDPVPTMVLMPLRQVRHVNSKLADIVARDGRRDRPVVVMHPDDGAAFDLADGDDAEVASATGALVAPVRFESGIRRGTVSVPHGFGEPNVNVLTSAGDSVDPISGMPQFSGVAVEIRRAPTTADRPASPSVSPSR